MRYQASGENSEEFLKALKREVIGHPALTHPFLERFAEGDADEEGVRTFAIQYYRHVRVSRLYLAALISNCRDDEGLQLALAEVLFDEYGHSNPDETHPALYRRFLGALGIGEEEWEGPRTLPEIEMYIATHYALSGHPDFRIGLGALGPASEWPVPPIYARLSDGLQEGRRAARRRAGDLHQPRHDGRDPRPHHDGGHRTLRGGRGGPGRVREGAMRSLDARSVMLDGLYRAVYGEPVPMFDAPSVRLTGR